MSSHNNDPKTLEDWAGSKHLGLTLLFTDIVKSTAIGMKLGDRTWIEDLFVHFNQARGLAVRYDSCVVKVIGDSLMVAFRSSTQAVECGLEFAMFTGIDYIGIRVAINSGEVQIRENDIYGLNVNLTSRIQSAIKAEGILVSDAVKSDYDKRVGSSSGITFLPEEVNLKDFGKKVLWRAESEALSEARRAQQKARFALLMTTWRPVPRMPN